MIDNKNHINYTAEDIRKYLSGELTPLQMNAMEKAALDDPFLAEAIEGYEIMPAEEWQDALAAAKKQLGEEKKGAKVIAMPVRRNNRWKIAAAVIVFLCAASVTYFIINKKDSPQIAKIETTPEPIIKSNPPIVDSIDNVTDKSESIASNLSTEKIKPEPGTYKNLNADDAIREDKQRDSGFVFTPTPTKPNTVIPAREEKDFSNAALAKKQTESVATNAAPAAPAIVSNNTNVAQGNTRYQGMEAFDKATDTYQKQSKKEQQLNRSFFAQVVGQDNTPLPFANVTIKSENFGTYADVKGNFRLVSSDSVLNVEVKSVGYQPKMYTIKSNLAQNKIILVEDDLSARQKTVVNSNATAKSKVSRKATLIKDSIVNVEPADGWDNYSTYVDNNIEIPDDILNNNIHGQVELSFEVKANGTITNIKVDKSLCDNCDEVAKRLLEQGPQWKVKKGKKGKGKVTVQF